MNIAEISKMISDEIIKQDLNIKDISNDTGLTYNPLYRFLKGEVLQPKVKLVITLFTYLKISNDKIATILSIPKEGELMINDKHFYSDESNKNIESLIKVKMILMGIKNKELALQIGVSPSYLSRILSVPDSSNLKVIIRICQLLHISYDEMLWCYGYYDDYPEIVSVLPTNNYPEVDSFYKKCTENCNILKPIKCLKKSYPDMINRFILISFNEDRNGYLLSSKYCTYELAVLLRECIKRMEKTKGTGSIRLYKENSNLSTRQYLELGSSLHSFPPGEFADKMRQSEVVTLFPFLYVMLRDIEKIEKKESETKKENETKIENDDV